ncbi:MAG: hypothetical protein NXI23_11715 [Bacteroidetes bacterium]|jgi:hypothetical protein|nr:hypothetical protein [Bacteroidota bacterium]
MRKLQILFFLGIFSYEMEAQTVVAVLDNSSFERIISDPVNPTPTGWFGCQMGSTADALPGVWNVNKKASEGKSYVGILTREDGTWESIGQELSEPLQKDACFTLTLDLARSEKYMTYNQPIKLRIWGGKDKCSKKQLLAESKEIQSTRWQAYSFAFFAKTEINYIILEAFNSERRPKKGNILIDNIRSIKRCVRASL